MPVVVFGQALRSGGLVGDRGAGLSIGHGVPCCCARGLRDRGAPAKSVGGEYPMAAPAPAPPRPPAHPRRASASAIARLSMIASTPSSSSSSGTSFAPCFSHDR